MKLTEKERHVLDLALYKFKEDCYTLWHAGELETAEWQDSALAIESTRKKIWKADVAYSPNDLDVDKLKVKLDNTEADDEKRAFDNLATHHERFSDYGEDD
tara:strand:- start:319 stop:621 length:303 start_codon:yes stop_codon:yes gene_type:complete